MHTSRIIGVNLAGILGRRGGSKGLVGARSGVDREKVWVAGLEARSPLSRQAWCCLQVKLCDPCLSVLDVPWCEKALYKYSSFPFLFQNKINFSLEMACFGEF